MYRRVNRFNSSTNKKKPFILYNFYEFHVEPKQESFSICSIDPGIKNCAFRFEDENRKTKMQRKVDLVDEENNYYKNLHIHLTSLLPHFLETDYILVESQMPFNTEMVRISQAIISFLTSSLTLLVKKENKVKPLIFELDPKIKSQILEPGLKLKKPQLKKWAVAKSLELLKEHEGEDCETIKEIVKSKKKDDFGDIICYTAASRKISIKKIDN